MKAIQVETGALEAAAGVISLAASEADEGRRLIGRADGAAPGASISTRERARVAAREHRAGGEGAPQGRRWTGALA